MAAPTLIYCAAGNRRYAEIAINAGFEYGAQLPHIVYYPPYFVDQNWRAPNRDAYMLELDRWRPHMASVLDLERADQLTEILGWAEDAARFVDVIMIIPKVQNGVRLLPRRIGGKTIRLGYSVPTAFAGTQLMLSEFVGWPVHLLGGSPQKQIEVSHYLDVVSADGNAVTKAAQYGNYWDGSKWQDIGGSGIDMPYRAFEKSCEGIKNMWNKL